MPTPSGPSCLAFQRSLYPTENICGGSHDNVLCDETQTWLLTFLSWICLLYWRQHPWGCWIDNAASCGSHGFVNWASRAVSNTSLWVVGWKQNWFVLGGLNVIPTLAWTDWEKSMLNCWWSFDSSGVWRCVVGQKVTDVSNDSSMYLHLHAKAVPTQRNGTTFSKNLKYDIKPGTSLIWNRKLVTQPKRPFIFKPAYDFECHCYYRNYNLTVLHISLLRHRN